MAKDKNKSNASTSTSTSATASTSTGQDKKRTQATAAFEIDDIFATKKPKPAESTSNQGPMNKNGKGKAKAVQQVPVNNVEEDADSDEDEDVSDDHTDDSSAEFDPEQEDEAEIEDDDQDDHTGKNSSKRLQPQTLDSISAAILANKNTKTPTVGSARVVETVVDPSSAIERYRPPPMGGVGNKLDEEELKFRDSRGDTSQSFSFALFGKDMLGELLFGRAGKRTEEGYPIYDTKELKIGLGGGKHCFIILPYDSELDIRFWSCSGTPDCPFDCQCCF
ncbi:BZ3500_MvSof-1268-A1-R1_Chr2-2g05091 [Microbotryum saponariae]|uniref:BZ3500_MvSof-1268-A1-R1_Chr2-2g05091 protein n=1 Tax=Microbotryum saponariae TaxID=289078 RepID=A0A2X0M9D7_9BASI|nr:BZ3500_MvSof-1268-A1-R1_Chr2-2g05091 [Microbotryum saponariae]SDA00890.1 BZ3501_MvSof-1269-A2-R1_Chr2-2g04765 [Microbotryum saponariae]